MVSRADGWWDETGGDGMGGWVNGRTVGAERKRIQQGKRVIIWQGNEWFLLVGRFPESRWWWL